MTSEEPRIGLLKTYRAKTSMNVKRVITNNGVIDIIFKRIKILVIT